MVLVIMGRGERLMGVGASWGVDEDEGEARRNLVGCGMDEDKGEAKRKRNGGQEKRRGYLIVISSSRTPPQGFPAVSCVGPGSGLTKGSSQTPLPVWKAEFWLLQS